MRRVIGRHIRRRTGGVQVAMDIDAVVAVNAGAAGATSAETTPVTRDASARAAEEGRDRPAEHTDQPPEEER